MNEAAQEAVMRIVSGLMASKMCEKSRSRRGLLAGPQDLSRTGSLNCPILVTPVRDMVGDRAANPAADQAAKPVAV